MNTELAFTTVVHAVTKERGPENTEQGLNVGRDEGRKGGVGI